jgi:hypothetical protein
MNAPPPLPKNLMIERSLRCFVLGIFGLVPVLGLPALVLAGLDSWRIGRDHRGLWNAAGAYLTAGRIMALIGLLLNGGVGLLIVAALMNLP